MQNQYRESACHELLSKATASSWNQVTRAMLVLFIHYSCGVSFFFFGRLLSPYIMLFFFLLLSSLRDLHSAEVIRHLCWLHPF